MSVGHPLEFLIARVLHSRLTRTTMNVIESMNPTVDTGFAVTLNEQVLERLVRASEFPGPGDPERFFYPDGFEPLIPDDPSTLGNPPDAGLIELETQDVITDWGFNYSCTGEGTVADPRLCFVEPNIFVSPLPI